MAWAASLAASLVFVGTTAARYTASGSDASSSAVGSASVETEVAGATVERRGAVEPAPTGHLIVVGVSVTACGTRSSGTAVLVDHDLLLTAAHVVGDAGLVRIDYGGQILTGEVRGVLGDGRDLALVEIDASMVQPLPAGTVPASGGPVTFVGFANGGTRSVLAGARLEVSPMAEAAFAGELLSVDSPGIAGLSGSPAVDARGDLIGIVVGNEEYRNSAVVVTVPDIGEIDDAQVVPGTCPTRA